MWSARRATRYTSPYCTIERVTPAKFQCRYLAFFGQCCHTETEGGYLIAAFPHSRIITSSNSLLAELYSRNWSPKCENGTAPLKITSGGLPHTVLGTSCDHEFCPPATHTCHKQVCHNAIQIVR